MNPRSFHWSPLQTLIVWVLVASVAAGVWYAVFYVAAHDEWLAANNKLAVAQTDLQAKQARVADVQRFGLVQDHDEAALAGEFSRVPGADGHGEDPLFVIPALADASGLVIDLSRPLPDEPAGTIVWAPALVEARGGWTALHAFLQRVGELPQVVAVDRLSARVLVDEELVWRFAVSVARLAPPAPVHAEAGT